MTDYEFANFQLVQSKLLQYIGYIINWTDRWKADEASKSAIYDALIVIEQAVQRARYSPKESQS